MPKITKVTEEEQRARLWTEDDWHPFVILSIEEEEGDYGPRLKWVFETLLEPEQPGQDPLTKWGWTGTKYGSGRATLTKYMNWLKIEVDENGIDTDDLVGTYVDIMFEHVKGVDSEGAPVWNANILKLKPGSNPEKPL